MARPLRIQYPGAFYHVMNRGNSRQNIFLADEDRYTFLEGLTDSCEIYGVRLICYVLMANHFHLIVQTEQANLSEFIHHFLMTYSVRYNRQRQRVGHLFQGRYKSLLIDAEAYLLSLSRYIHLNPIQTKRFQGSDFKTKVSYIKDNRWSSLSGYCSVRKRIEGVDYAWLLKVYFSGDNVKGRGEYWNYVCQGLKGEIENPFDHVVYQTILGTKGFVERVKNKVSWKKEREVPALRRLRRSFSVEKIMEVIGSSCGVEPIKILNRKTGAKLVRQMAMELCYRYSPLNQREIGEMFSVDYSTVSRNRGDIKKKLQKDTQLKKKFDEIEQRIFNLSKRKT